MVAGGLLVMSYTMRLMSGHFVDDPHADTVQHVVGDSGPVRSHEVCGGNGAQGQGVVVGPAVAHDAHGAHVGQHGEVLVHGAFQTGLGDLVAEDKIGQAQGVQLLLGDLADHTDGKAGTGEGLTHDQVLRQAQLPAQLTDLVLEQHPQGLDDLLEIHIVGKAAHVVVALDDSGIAGAGFDHIRIDRALNQVIDTLPIFLASSSKTRINSSPMILRFVLRLGDTGQLGKETLLGIDPNKVDVPLLQRRPRPHRPHFAHEAVIYKHTGELVADGRGEQCRRHGGIHTAGQREQNLAVANLFPNLFDGGFLHSSHGPVAGASADLIEELA